MRPTIIKAYGSLHPASDATFRAVKSVLEDWFLPDAARMEGDMLLISHEGDHFPADDVVEAIRPFLTEASDGKMDILDLEAWTLRRFSFRQGRLTDRSAPLDKALESCSRPG